MACLLCEDPSAENSPSHNSTQHIDCSICGEYLITLQAHYAIGSDVSLRLRIASWVSGQSLSGIVPLVKEEDVSSMKTYPKPSVEKRAELYLGAVIRGFKGELTGSFDGQAKAMRVASWSTNGNDCIALAHYLAEQGALQQDKNQAQVFHLVAKGHLLWEKMAERRASSSQAFVAMWFDAQTLDAYTNGIGPAVVASGHEPLRIDGQQHVDKIDDRIIAEIRRSRFVVADFTGHRGGVYYEAGFAHGLGLRVIFTCRKDHFEKMHFDTRQYNTILWTNTSELRVELQNRILAIFGAGPHKPAAKSLPTTDYQ